MNITVRRAQDVHELKTLAGAVNITGGRLRDVHDGEGGSSADRAIAELTANDERTDQLDGFLQRLRRRLTALARTVSS